MFRTMLKSKIHRATVTQADLHYVGSVTVDEDLLDAADLLPGEQVAIVDITNGARLETYVIPGPRGSGVIGINGAAAHLVHPGDLVILISYAMLDDAAARSYQPRVVHVDTANRIVELDSDPAGAPPGTAGDPIRGDQLGTDRTSADRTSADRTSIHPTSADRTSVHQTSAHRTSAPPSSVDRNRAGQAAVAHPDTRQPALA